jgi:predicted signal transduction protein with EAL and GGDEF domain
VKNLRSVTQPADVHKVSEILRDAETGLYNEVFYTASVPTRVASAKRALRPLSIVVLAAAGVRAERLADALQRTVREADLACRLDHGRFGVLLEETPADGAVRMVDRLGRALAEPAGAVQVWAGVAAYPTDALDAVALLQAADAALREAMASGRSKIQLASDLTVAPPSRPATLTPAWAPVASDGGISQ